MNSSSPRHLLVALLAVTLAAPLGACDEALDEGPSEAWSAPGGAEADAWPSPPSPVPEGTPRCRYDAHQWGCLIEVVGPGYLVVALGDGSLAYRRHTFARWTDLGLSDELDHALVGFAADAAGALSSDLAPIAIPSRSAPAPTRTVWLEFNLDSGAPLQDADAFRADDPTQESSFSTSLFVYDTVGEQRRVDVYFTRTDDRAWVWHLVADGGDLEGSTYGEPVSIATGALAFDFDGLLVSATGDPATVTFAGAGPQTVRLEFGDGETFGGTYSWSGSSSLHFLDQDGREPGWLASLRVDWGAIRAKYTNGHEALLGQLAVALFEAPSLMQPLGSGLWAATERSGPPEYTHSGGFGGVRIASWNRTPTE